VDGGGRSDDRRPLPISASASAVPLRLGVAKVHGGDPPREATARRRWARHSASSTSGAAQAKRWLAEGARVIIAGADSALLKMMAQATLEEIKMCAEEQAWTTAWSAKDSRPTAWLAIARARLSFLGSNLAGLCASNHRVCHAEGSRGISRAPGDERLLDFAKAPLGMTALGLTIPHVEVDEAGQDAGAWPGSQWTVSHRRSRPGALPVVHC